MRKINPYIKNRQDYVLADSIVNSFNPVVDSEQPVYIPSAVGECCVSNVGDIVKFHSDVHLLLHQKNLADKIGLDNVRSYLEQINSDFSVSTDYLKDMSDEQLLSLVRDRRFNTLTDNYELQQVLNENYQSILDDLKSKEDYKTKQDELFSQLNSKLTSKSD